MPTLTVRHLIDRIERMPGDRVAVESAQRKLTLSEVRRLSNRLANALLGLGLAPGDRVAYAAHNSVEYVILEFALAKAGLVKVPLNPRMTAREILSCFELADVRLVVSDLATATILDQVRDEPAFPVAVSIGDRHGWLAIDALMQAASDVAPRVPVAPDDLYHVRFSSGSTGRPKGIAISQAAARSAILGNSWVFGTTAPASRPRTLQVAPLVYAGGWSVLPTLLSGGTNVIAPRFDADETLRMIRDESIDWMFAVPTMLRRMAESPSVELLSGSPLGCLMSAGEPAAIPALEVLTAHTEAVVQCWGQTEAPASTTYLGREDMRDPSLWASIGRPIPSVDFGLVAGGDVTAEIAPGQEGELAIRSATIASALLGATEEYERRLLDDGWWRTGDLGRFDEDGRIFLIGRASETIITGGTNIQPVEIERALEAHDQVIEAIVVGVPDTRWGETPAALVHAPGLVHDGASLWSWLGDRVARFKLPGHLFVSGAPLPRASSEAKVARGTMKKQIEAWVVGESLPPEIKRMERPRG